MRATLGVRQREGVLGSQNKDRQRSTDQIVGEMTQHQRQQRAVEYKNRLTIHRVFLNRREWSEGRRRVNGERDRDDQEDQAYQRDGAAWQQISGSHSPAVSR